MDECHNVRMYLVHKHADVLQADISKEEDVHQMVAAAVKAFGRLDILINNAARFVFNVVTEITDEGSLALHSSITFRCSS